MSRRSRLLALAAIASVVWGVAPASGGWTTTTTRPGLSGGLPRRPRDGASYVLYGASKCPYPPTLVSGHVYLTAGGLTGCWSDKTKPSGIRGVEPEAIGECAVCLHFQL